jgi:hypothetical protein
MVATSMGKSKKAVAQFLGQMDTGATERYMHAAEPELWAVAQQLEAELGVIPEAAAVAQMGGVKNGVNSDALGCSQLRRDVGKSGDFRLERWPSGRRRTPAKRPPTNRITGT